MKARSILPGVLCLMAAWAQDRPVIDPRGVTNAFTQEPAPARVSLGGLMEIKGLSLGPAEGATATATPWPLELAGVQVFVNAKQAAIYSVNPASIIAQVPPDVAVGFADITVLRAGVRSRAARVNVVDRQPAVKTQSGLGWGQPASKASGGTLTLTAAGLGPTDPVLAVGEAAVANPKAEIAVFIGGLPAPAGATASASRPGEFEIQVQAPAGARPGDLINVLADRQSANRTIYESLAGPEVQFLSMPDGAPEIRFLADTDLNGQFVMGTGARDDNGCYAAVIFDFRAGKAANVGDCLTAGNRNAATALVIPGEGTTVGALVGPPQGEAPAGVSAQMRIFGAGDPVDVGLPAAASNLAAVAGGDFAAVMPGTPASTVTVDGRTGQLGDVRQGGGGGLGGGAIPAGVLNVNVDGLTHALAFMQVNQGRVAVIVGDDADEPKRAKFAIVALGSGDVVTAKDFPDGWLPLMGEAAPAQPVQPGAAPRPVQPLRLALTYDAQRRIWYALAKAAGKHGFVAFTADNAAPKEIAFPDGWFAATCTPNVGVFALELSRRIALIGTSTLETSFKQQCPGTGFIAMDLANQNVVALAAPQNAQINATAANEINDYIYAADIDPSRRGQAADTVFVLDGVTATAFTLALPTGVDAFQNLQRIPELSSLVGAAGAGGLAVFNLDQATATVLPVPDGYNTVTHLDVFLASRKLVARALRPRGSQLVIYGLASGEVTPVPNPEGVASVGPPAQAAGGGQLPGNTAAVNRLVSANPKANTVTALAYDADGNQKGVVVVRVP